MTKTISADLAREGYVRATNRDEKAIEATLLVDRATSGDPRTVAVLMEAFTTSDFPVLLGQGLQAQAIQAYKDTPKEFEDVVFDVSVPDFTRRRLIDHWGAEEFERVHEGEEYKGSIKQTTDLEHGLGKFGKNLGITWELFLNRRVSDISNYPRDLSQGAVKTQNSAAADLLVKNGAWNPDFFKTVSNLPLTPENLRTAIQELAVRENHRGELVDVSDLYLVHGPALRAQVTDMLVNLSELEMTTTDGNKATKVKLTNPFRNVVKPLESRSIGKRLGAASATAWALVQGKSSDLPSIIRTSLSGHPEVDIRVKNDQGQSLGGGALSPMDGGFQDDTIWYRGRSVLGIDPGFTPGVWASKGA